MEYKSLVGVFRCGARNMPKPERRCLSASSSIFPLAQLASETAYRAPGKGTPMRRTLIAAALIAVAIAVLLIGDWRGATAQDATPATKTTHPFVGSWIVDTIVASDADSPEIAIVTPDGQLAGLGANRVAAGTWEAIDDHTAMLTLVSVFDGPDGAGYIIVRGPHTVDATGNAWTCACTFTVVGADGTVLDSGDAPAAGRRLPLQGPDMVGQPLAEVPRWTSPFAAATPAP